MFFFGFTIGVFVGANFGLVLFALIKTSSSEKYSDKTLTNKTNVRSEI